MHSTDQRICCSVGKATTFCGFEDQIVCLWAVWTNLLQNFDGLPRKVDGTVSFEIFDFVMLGRNFPKSVLKVDFTPSGETNSLHTTGCKDGKHQHPATPAVNMPESLDERRDLVVWKSGEIFFSDGVLASTFHENTKRALQRTQILRRFTVIHRPRPVQNRSDVAQRFFRCDGFGCPNRDQYITDVFNRNRIDADLAEMRQHVSSEKVTCGVRFLPVVYPVVGFHSVFQPQIHNICERLGGRSRFFRRLENFGLPTCCAFGSWIDAL